MENDPLRSRRWTGDPRPRYWWHRLPGTDYVPPIYSDLAEDEWIVLRDWYDETDASGRIGESAVPLVSLLQGLIMGSRAERIVELGTCSGYSTLLIGFMLRRLNARHGLFTLDYDPAVVAITERWLNRAGLKPFVRNTELLSTSREALVEAVEYLGQAPELIILDTSHQYQATLEELDHWYPLLAPGGLLLLHDASKFAIQFDTTGQGGVHRAFKEWRAAHPAVEAMMLNGESRTMDGPRPFYKDACGLAILHKPAMPGAA
jgi:predicted O-methyltransferase YrrM